MMDKDLRLSWTFILVVFTAFLDNSGIIRAETISPTVEERSDNSTDPSLFVPSSKDGDDVNVANIENNQIIPSPIIVQESFTAPDTGTDSPSLNRLQDDPILDEIVKEGDTVLEEGLDGIEEIEDSVFGNGDGEEHEGEEKEGVEEKVVVVDRDGEEKEEEKESEKGVTTSPEPEIEVTEGETSGPEPETDMKNFEPPTTPTPTETEDDFDLKTISCWSCNSIQDNECDGHGSDFGGLDHQKCRCSQRSCHPPGIDPSDSPVGCMKLIQEIPSHPNKERRTRIVRQCAYSGENQSGFKTVGHKGVKTWVYQCNNTNECNHAGHPVAVTFMLPAVMLTVLFVMSNRIVLPGL